MCWVLMLQYNPDTVPADKELRKEWCKVEGISFPCDLFMILWPVVSGKQYMNIN